MTRSISNSNHAGRETHANLSFNHPSIPRTPELPWEITPSPVTQPLAEPEFLSLVIWLPSVHHSLPIIPHSHLAAGVSGLSRFIATPDLARPSPVSSKHSRPFPGISTDKATIDPRRKRHARKPVLESIPSFFSLAYHRSSRVVTARIRPWIFISYFAGDGNGFSQVTANMHAWTIHYLYVPQVCAFLTQVYIQGYQWSHRWCQDYECLTGKANAMHC